MNRVLMRALQAYQQGRCADALDWLAKVADGDPDEALTRRVQGLCWLALGEPDAAFSALQMAVSLVQASGQGTALEQAEVLNDAALAALACNRLDEGLVLLSQALPLVRAAEGGWMPEAALILSNYGNLLRRMGESEGAVSALEQAIALEPLQWGSWNNLGLVWREMGKNARAASAFAEAIRLGAASGAQVAVGELVSASVHWAFSLMSNELWGEAAAVLDQALTWDPRDQAVWNARGFWALKQDDPVRAVSDFDRALDLLPPPPANATERASSLAGRAAALFDLGHYGSALVTADEAIGWDPQSAEAHLNRATALLVHGRFAEGWEDLDYRWSIPDFQRRYRLPQVPLWDGQAHSGQTLLVRSEQAFGDALMMSRFLPLLAERFAGRLIVECHQPLGSLFATVPGVDLVITVDAQASWPEHQWQVSLMSVPRLLGVTAQTVPDAACLMTGARQAAGPSVPGGAGPVIGLCWAGRAQPRNRSVALDELWPVLQAASEEIPVRWVCLQADERRDEVQFKDDLWIPPMPQSFAETAALMVQMDLVITIDSAVLHLAGAVGTPVAGLLLAGACWRYGLPVAQGQSGSPWYPSAALFRQPTHGDWDGAIQALGLWLRKWLEAKG